MNDRKKVASVSGCQHHNRGSFLCSGLFSALLLISPLQHSDLSEAPPVLVTPASDPARWHRSARHRRLNLAAAAAGQIWNQGLLVRVFIGQQIRGRKTRDLSSRKQQQLNWWFTKM